MPNLRSVPIKAHIDSVDCHTCASPESPAKPGRRRAVADLAVLVAEQDHKAVSKLGDAFLGDCPEIIVSPLCFCSALGIEGLSATCQGGFPSVHNHGNNDERFANYLGTH